MTELTRFAPASAVLAVLLVAVPVTLPARVLGPATGAGSVRTPAAVSASTTPAVLHLRLAALPMPDRGELPHAMSPASPEPEAAQRTHTIAPGETLWDVSRAAGVSVSAVAAANHISERGTLHPGQVLAIPAGSSVPASSAVVPVASAAGATQARTHTVAPGDSLWEIARASNVSVAALAAVNRLSPEGTLRPGQVLTVPPAGTPAPRIPARAVGPAAAVKPGPAAAPAQRGISRAVAAAVPSRSSMFAQRMRLIWPSSGIVTSRFGWRIHPIFGTREFHTGMDIATRWGSPVLAARNGVVRFAGWMAGYGWLIVVDHGGGLETKYSHLSAMLVGSGQRVNEGEMIGRIGSTGWSTGPHLFFEVHQNGVAEDPTRYLH